MRGDFSESKLALGGATLDLTAGQYSAKYDLLLKKPTPPAPLRTAKAAPPQVLSMTAAQLSTFPLPLLQTENTPWKFTPPARLT